MDEHHPAERDRQFAAETVFTQLQALLKEIPGVRLAEDPECLHRMRVASRRLRTSLALLGDYLPSRSLTAWTKQMRRVTKTLGAARDLDVQIICLQEILAGISDTRCRPGIARLLLRLQQSRARRQRKVLDTLEELAQGHTIKAMEGSLRRGQTSAAMTQRREVSPALYLHAESAISARLLELLSYEVYLNDPAQIANLHAMRIAAKRLRYSLQTFTPIFTEKPRHFLDAARSMQDLLGEIHDCDVWLELLPRFQAEERQRQVKFFGHTREFMRLQRGLEYLAEERRQVREGRYRAFLKLWRATRKQEVWEELRQFLRDQARAVDAAEGHPPGC